MSSAARRLRRLAQRAELTQLKSAPENADYGCALCRGAPRRQELTRDLIASGLFGSAICRCTDCGADWLVSLFEGAGGMACVSFARPAGKRTLN